MHSDRRKAGAGRGEAALQRFAPCGERRFVQPSGLDGGGSCRGRLTAASPHAPLRTGVRAGMAPVDGHPTGPLDNELVDVGGGARAPVP